jgi:dihydrofolate reductase
VENSRLIKENIAEEIRKMKQQSGKNMIMYGGAEIASAFMKFGLIDEYRIIVNPVILGRGKPLFKDVRDRMNLKLVKTRTFKCGNVSLYYQPGN